MFGFFAAPPAACAAGDRPSTRKSTTRRFLSVLLIAYPFVTTGAVRGGFRAGYAGGCPLAMRRAPANFTAALAARGSWQRKCRGGWDPAAADAVLKRGAKSAFASPPRGVYYMQVE